MRKIMFGKKLSRKKLTDEINTYVYCCTDFKAKLK